MAYTPGSLTHFLELDTPKESSRKQTKLQALFNGPVEQRVANKSHLVYVEFECLVEVLNYIKKLILFHTTKYILLTVYLIIAVMHNKPCTISVGISGRELCVHCVMLLACIDVVPQFRNSVKQSCYICYL